MHSPQPIGNLLAGGVPDPLDRNILKERLRQARTLPGRLIRNIQS